jgi:fibronectin type 3 domain-containing protein
MQDAKYPPIDRYVNSGGVGVARGSYVLIVVLLLTLVQVVGILGPVEGPEEEIVQPEAVDNQKVVRPVELAKNFLASSAHTFLENDGQYDAEGCLFYARGDPLSVAFGPGWVEYLVGSEPDVPRTPVRIVFKDANPSIPVGSGPLKTRTNFIVGNDPGGWVTDVRSFSEVLYSDLWRGIDLRYTFHDGQLKYTFELEAGATSSNIALIYDDEALLDIDTVTGDLLIQVMGETLVDGAPYTFQEGGSGPIAIESGFHISDRSTVTFEIGPYDVGVPLIIDPGLDFSTYFGGIGKEEFSGDNQIAYDDEGNIIFCGRTNSQDLPTSTGAYANRSFGWDDCFVAKLSSNASELIFSTYFGGNGNDDPAGLVVDPDGTLYLTGYTTSTNFPTTPDAFSDTNDELDSFVVALNETGGQLLYGTYFGGNDADYPMTIAYGPPGNITIAGLTRSNDYPTTGGAFCTTWGGAYDIVVSRFSVVDWGLEFSTYIGGLKDDYVQIITTDWEGNVYLAGSSASSKFPITDGALQDELKSRYDGILLRLSHDGSQLDFSTFFGGNEDDSLINITLDGSGRIWVSGSTRSTDLPTTSNAIQSEYRGGNDEGIIVQFSADGSEVLYCTYIGGKDGEKCDSMVLDGDGRIVVVGSTSSEDFMMPSTAYDDTLGGGYDTYIYWLDIENRRILNGTFLGGDELHNYEYPGRGGLFINALRQFVLVGTTISSDYPTTEDAYQPDHGWGDLFISGVSMDLAPWDLATAPTNIRMYPRDGYAFFWWDPPQYNGSWPIQNYTIYMGESAGSETEIATVTGLNRYTCLNLTNGKEYFFRISANTIVGEGAMTDSIGVVPTGIPKEPQNFTLTPGLNSINLSWDPPTDHGGFPLLGYNIFRGDARDNLSLLTDLGMVSSYLDEGLVRGVPYFYRIQAFHSFANGTLTKIMSAVPVGLPGPPENLTALSGTGQVALNWSLPIDDGGIAVTSYNLYRGPTPAALELFVELSWWLFFLDMDVTNGVTYYYALTAVSPVGEGPWSPIINATPLGFPGEVENLLTDVDDGRVSLSWNAPSEDGGAPVTAYRIYQGPTLGPLTLVAETGDVRSYNDTGLTNGETYYYQVTAVNEVGEGPAKDPVWAVPIGPPSAPMGLVPTPGAGIIELAWQPPDDDGGSVIETYRLFKGTSADDLEWFYATTGEEFNMTDEDVVIGQTYYYAILAVNYLHMGPLSVVVEASPFGPPDAPFNLSLVQRNEKVVIEWSKPLDDGGSAILGFHIYRGTSPQSLALFKEVEVRVQYLDLDLEIGVTYHYAIATVNAAGEGPMSDDKSITIHSRPGVPTDLVAKAVGRTVVLSWTQPDDGGSPITSYWLYRGTTSDNLTIIGTLLVNDTFTDKTVERGTTYFYSLMALNEIGGSGGSSVVEVKVPKKPKDKTPGLPAEVTILALASVGLVLGLRRGRKGRF